MEIGGKGFIVPKLRMFHNKDPLQAKKLTLSCNIDYTPLLLYNKHFFNSTIMLVK